MISAAAHLLWFNNSTETSEGTISDQCSVHMLEVITCTLLTTRGMNQKYIVRGSNRCYKVRTVWIQNNMYSHAEPDDSRNTTTFNGTKQRGTHKMNQSKGTTFQMGSHLKCRAVHLITNKQTQWSNGREIIWEGTQFWFKSDTKFMHEQNTENRGTLNASGYPNQMPFSLIYIIRKKRCW